MPPEVSAELLKRLAKMDALVRRQTEVSDQIGQLRQKSAIDGTSLDDRTVAEQRSALEAEQAAIEANLAKHEVVMLGMLDHRPLLLKALDLVQRRLLIVSPWIDRGGFDRDVQARLRKALERGVKVRICYGMPDDRRPPSSHVLAVLQQLKRDFQNFSTHHVGTHSKILAVDDAMVAVGSFNWLSFGGREGAAFRDEQSILIRVPSAVNQYFLMYENVAELKARSDRSLTELIRGPE